MRLLQETDWPDETGLAAGPESQQRVTFENRDNQLEAPVDTVRRIRFEQFHIDVARNSSDDFTPLHDPHKWRTVRHNPFGGPIVSAFQLASMVEALVRKQISSAESKIINKRDLHFCNYDFRFSGHLLAAEECQVQIPRLTLRPGERFALSHRALVTKAGKSVMVGKVEHSNKPMYLADADLALPQGLEKQPDITYVPDSEYFLKRKYLSTGSAKNFLIGSMVDQAYYFDEVQDRVRFPDLLPVSFIASTLFEKNAADNVDFRDYPTVHARQLISVDQRLADRLRSNDRLQLLVKGPVKQTRESISGLIQRPTQRFDCFGLVRDDQLLFRAQIFMLPLPAAKAWWV